jgi:hypothetical protein
MQWFIRAWPAAQGSVAYNFARAGNADIMRAVGED